jgi:hypothetical protein
VTRSRIRGAIPPLLQYAFTMWCSVKAQGKLYFIHKKYVIKERKNSEQTNKQTNKEERNEARFINCK